MKKVLVKCQDYYLEMTIKTQIPVIDKITSRKKNEKAPISCHNEEEMVKEGLRIPLILEPRKQLKKKFNRLSSEQLDNLKTMGITGVKTELEALKILRNISCGPMLQAEKDVRKKRLHGDIHTPYNKNSGNQKRKRSNHLLKNIREGVSTL